MESLAGLMMRHMSASSADWEKDSLHPDRRVPRVRSDLFYLAYSLILEAKRIEERLDRYPKKTGDLVTSLRSYHLALRGLILTGPTGVRSGGGKVEKEEAWATYIPPEFARDLSFRVTCKLVDLVNLEKSDESEEDDIFIWVAAWVGTDDQEVKAWIRAFKEGAEILDDPMEMDPSSSFTTFRRLCHLRRSRKGQ